MMEVMEYDMSYVEPLDADVIGKYKMAADVANLVVTEVIGVCLPGANVGQLCQFGDKLVHEKLAAVFTTGQVEKGPAFPVCLSVNNVATNFSPLEEDSKVLQAGDVVKIVLGVQIDGYIATAGHTHIINTTPETPVTGRAADAVCAAHLAGDIVHKMLRPGVNSTDITAAVEEIAKTFRCKGVMESGTVNTKRFVMEGDKMIVNQTDPREQLSEGFVVEANEVYSVDVMMSTGEGRLKDAEIRTTVYQRDCGKQHGLKLKASRKLFTEISQRFPTMPFTMRELNGADAETRIGLKEPVTHGLLLPFPVQSEKKNQIVAQFKFTVLVKDKQTERLSSFPLPYVHSVYEVVNPELKDLLARKSVVY